MQVHRVLNLSSILNKQIDYQWDFRCYAQRLFLDTLLCPFLLNLTKNPGIAQQQQEWKDCQTLEYWKKATISHSMHNAVLLVPRKGILQSEKLLSLGKLRQIHPTNKGKKVNKKPKQVEWRLIYHTTQKVQLATLKGAGRNKTYLPTCSTRTEFKGLSSLSHIGFI